MEEYGCNCSFDSAGNPVDWCSFHEALRDSLAEKDKEIERLTEELESHSWEISPAMAQKRIDTLWEENKRLERDILMLARLCLSNGIISRGLACEYLGCAREDLDDVIKEDIMRKNDLIYDPSIGKRGGYLVTLYGYDRTGVEEKQIIMRFDPLKVDGFGLVVSGGVPRKNNTP